MNNKGQALAEYILIIAFVTVIIVALVNVFGGYLKDTLTKSGCNLSGQEYIGGEKPGGGYCEQ